MATMKTLNGYGFNATEFNGKAASDYLQKTDTAADSAKLGGKAPEYYLSPRNLLDNSDFRNPVNQRGVVYGANRNNGYAIDRWYYEQSAGAGDGYFGLTEYYVSLLAPSDGYSQMYQNLEKYAKLKGKNVTFAALINRGGTEKIVCVTFTLGSIDVGLNLFEDGSLKLYSIDGMNILIRATGAEEFKFIWAALYEGAYTADTLPPYVPKGYAAELAECQRYYWEMQTGTNFILRIRNQHETNNYSAFDLCPCITFPVPMRIVPTVNISYDITDGTLSHGAPFDCSRTSCTVPAVSIPHGGWFDLNSLVASADL